MTLKNKIVIIILVFLSGFFLSFAEKDMDSLREKLKHNQELFRTNPEKAYRESQLLIEQAIREKNTRAELQLYSMHCWYFSRKSDLSSIISSAKKLKEYSIRYKSPRYEANSHIYLLQAYMENKLYDKAIEQYEQALDILNKADSNDQRVIITKGTAHTYMANVYTVLKDYEKAVEKLKLAIEGDLKITDEDERNLFLHNSYSNLAGAYLEVNLDSAEYYLNESVQRTPANASESFITYLNKQIEGNIHKKRGNLEQALESYRLAEENPNKDPVNLELLYKSVVEIYEDLGDTENLEVYKQKLKDIQLLISNNKYDSMHLILEDKNSTEQNSALSVTIFIIIVVLSGMVVFYFYRRNKLYHRKLKNTEEKLKSVINNKNNREEEKPIVDKQVYDELADIALNNNKMFMAAFNNVFPDFSEKLLKTNPTLAQTEIEFSAYLKLNFSSKEIAQIKSIQTRSVQNKKNRLRKRLNIPQNIDIYHWFNQDFNRI